MQVISDGVTFMQVISDGVATVAAGAFHSMVVKNDGSLWASGSNKNGQFGDGSTISENRFIRLKPFAEGASHTRTCIQTHTNAYTHMHIHMRIHRHHTRTRWSIFMITINSLLLTLPYLTILICTACLSIVLNFRHFMYLNRSNSLCR